MKVRRSEMSHQRNGERGFTIIEVAVASLISMVGLIFLASLFTLSITQNRTIKQNNATTALAQQKLEEINAIDYDDDDMRVGGDLFEEKSDVAPSGRTVNYFDEVYVEDQSGTVYVGDQIPDGILPNYRRFWRIESDTELINTIIVSARVVALQAARSGRPAEETTLVTVRSF
jgi:hypothetical protein